MDFIIATKFSEEDWASHSQKISSEIPCIHIPVLSEWREMVASKMVSVR
jgi:hypothetical protein